MDRSWELRREMQKGLLKWYGFDPAGLILYIGDASDPLPEDMLHRGLAVTCADVEETAQPQWYTKRQKNFDYVVSITDLERMFQPVELLRIWRNLLKSDGVLLLGMQNRLGVRYFCGDRDPYTCRVFDGVEHYRNFYWHHPDNYPGRMYSKSEIKQLLKEAGWDNCHMFSVLCDIRLPTLIYAEDFEPNEELFTRVFPIYNSTDTIFLDEEALYEDLVKNGMFHQMPAAYLVECSAEGNFSDVRHVTLSLMRGAKHARMTIIRRSGIVEKQSVYSQGREGLHQLASNLEDLRAHGLSVVAGHLKGNSYCMPYMKAEAGQIYLKRLMKDDLERFLHELDKFRDRILSSSEIVQADRKDGKGAILRRGYLDLIPVNSFYENDDFIFYDQEFCEGNYPANALIWRMIFSLYSWDGGLHQYYPRERLLERYGLTAYRRQWEKMEVDFLCKLRKDDEFADFRRMYQKHPAIMVGNRWRMNFSDYAYQHAVVNPLDKLGQRKLIIFGSGKYAHKFLELYGCDYPVFAIVDNNSERWGKELDGIPIQSPSIMRDLTMGEYMVWICIKNFLPIIRQLEEWNISSYGVYDVNRDYHKPSLRVETAQKVKNNNMLPKRYHIGYIAGVFDLFHLGHLNMFKRAKEQCDFLIVGVVTDEGVRKNKKVEPFIPFDERLEIVRSCRYVDKAVKIPLVYCDTQDAWRMYHFDVQFSGSDYENDEFWLSKKKFLEKHGATMVFFPYTQSTSSSQIKRLIEKRLL